MFNSSMNSSPLDLPGPEQPQSITQQQQYAGIQDPSHQRDEMLPSGPSPLAAQNSMQNQPSMPHQGNLQGMPQQGGMQALPRQSGMQGLFTQGSMLQEPTMLQMEQQKTNIQPMGQQEGRHSGNQQSGLQTAKQPYGPTQKGQADLYQGAPNGTRFMDQSQPHKSLDATAEQQPNQPMYQAQLGQSAHNSGGSMPGPAESGERGWKGAAAGGISGGFGGHQVGETGTTLISTLAGAVLGSEAEDKFFKGDGQGDDDSKLHQLLELAQNNGADSSKLQQLVNMTHGNSPNQHKTNQAPATQQNHQGQNAQPEYQESEVGGHTMQRKGMGGLLGGPGLRQAAGLTHPN